MLPPAYLFSGSQPGLQPRELCSTSTRSLPSVSIFFQFLWRPHSSVVLEHASSLPRLKNNDQSWACVPQLLDRMLSFTAKHEVCSRLTACRAFHLASSSRLRALCSIRPPETPSSTNYPSGAGLNAPLSALAKLATLHLSILLTNDFIP